jgi:serine/threonine protein kinase
MLGRFEVLRKIATGGMAEIYLARLRGRAGFEKLVVVKRISPEAAGNPKLIQMFHDEARLVATLQHPNIADVYEVGEYQGVPFFAMEHLHGRDVRSIRKTASEERKQGVPLRVSLAIIHATASALDYAHDRRGPDGANLNLVHRDISPSNIVVTYEGAIKLIDFGVARVTTQTHTTQAGTVRGKCPYMSPEQCRGWQLDRRSDLFSLGSVLYELTVGRRPFVGASDFEIMNQIVNVDAPRPSSLTQGYPPELERIVMKLLARDTEKRHQKAEELLHDLEPFLDAKHLWVPPTKLSRYMRSLFSDRVIAWEQATHGDTDTFAEVAALQMEQDEQDTPPMPVQVVMRLQQEMEAVAEDFDASLALVHRPGDANDPLLAALEDSIAFRAGGDTQTVRTGEQEVFDASVAQPASGETVTVRTAEPDHQDSVALRDSVATHDSLSVVLQDSISFRDSIAQPSGDSVAHPSGDTLTTPWEGREAYRAPTSVDTVTQRDHSEAGDDTTAADASLDKLRPLDRTSPGWLPPATTTGNAQRVSAPRLTPPPSSPTGRPQQAQQRTQPREAVVEPVRAIRVESSRPVRVTMLTRPPPRQARLPEAGSTRRLWFLMSMVVLVVLSALVAILHFATS